MVARIDSGSAGKTPSERTLSNAVLFAQLFAEQMPPPNNGIHPARISVPLLQDFRARSCVRAGDVGR